MSTIIKGPQQVGEEYIGTVAQCGEVKGKFDQQVRFEFTNGDTLFLPAKSAARQLIRIGFDAGGDPPLADYEAVPGNTLLFGRDENPGGKPYWRVELASVADTKPRPASKRVPSPTPVPGTPPKAAQEAAMREANRHSPKALPGHDPEAPPFVPVEYDDKAGAETYAPYIESQPMGGSKRVRDWEAIERAYQWALATAYAAQTNVLGTEMGEGLTPTMESVQAGAATLLIAADKMGAIR